MRSLIGPWSWHSSPVSGKQWEANLSHRVWWKKGGLSSLLFEDMMIPPIEVHPSLPSSLMSPENSVLCHSTCNIQLALMEHLLRDRILPQLRNSGLLEATSPILPMFGSMLAAVHFACYFAVWLDPFGNPVGLQACCDCKLMPEGPFRGQNVSTCVFSL